MDLHIVPGVNAKDVAEAHRQDVYLEKDHSCKCLTYWVDEMRGHVFCLIDAPSQETVYELHNRSHGLVPHKIIEVQPDFVQSFLGRITDPSDAPLTDNGLLLIDETSYRMIMSVQLPDTVLLQHEAGIEPAKKKVQQILEIIRNEITAKNGKEAIQEQHSIIGSFITAEKAVAAGLAIHQQLQQLNSSCRISIHAGEPVTQHDKLFGETLQFLQRMHFIQRKEQVGISASVRELVAKELMHKTEADLFSLSANDEQLLNALFNALEEKYSDADFQMDEYAQSLAMSQSQLYRKTTALTGYSPNDLLKEYRLAKAIERLKKGNQNITEITFDCGFNSPSYFTKCFKKKFGLLPLTYQELV